MGKMATRATVALAVAVLSGCGGHRTPAAGPAQLAPTTSTTGVSPSTPPPVAPSPAGRPVPAGFQVQSATFVSAAKGWALGTAPCAAAPCTALARTTDGGAQWVGIPAPPTNLATSLHQTNPGVSEVRFADGANGWAFGPDLWATHDGGSTWTRVAIASGSAQVVALETAGGEVDAVVTDCTASSSPCSAQLWHAAVATDRFALVGNVTLPGGVSSGGGTSSLFVHARSGYLIGTPVAGHGVGPLWVTTDGTTWSAGVAPCGPTLALDTIALAPGGAGGAVALCTGEGAAGSTTKTLYRTDDAGRSWAPVGPPAPREGVGGTVIAAGASTLVITTASGAAEIYRSGDGGATWTTALRLADGGTGFGDVGFTTATRGFAVHAPAARVDQGGSTPSAYGPYPATLFLTIDGGTTWKPVTI